MSESHAVPPGGGEAVFNAKGINAASYTYGRREINIHRPLGVTVGRINLDVENQTHDNLL